jgi:hypothetical protein
MSEILEYPDNLVLHLGRDKRSYKVFTTDVPDRFKVINGLYIGDSVIDTTHINLRELKQLMVDSCINGYEIKSNLIFKKGLLGIAKELAKEREEQIKQQELLKEEEVSAEVVSDSEDENKIKIVYHEEGEEKIYEVVPEVDSP